MYFRIVSPGHCLCYDCWNLLEPRRCPECRLMLPPLNRNRDREELIAYLRAVPETRDQEVQTFPMACSESHNLKISK